MANADNNGILRGRALAARLVLPVPMKVTIMPKQLTIGVEDRWLIGLGLWVSFACFVVLSA